MKTPGTKMKYHQTNSKSLEPEPTPKPTLHLLLQCFRHISHLLSFILPSKKPPKEPSLSRPMSEFAVLLQFQEGRNSPHEHLQLDPRRGFGRKESSLEALTQSSLTGTRGTLRSSRKEEIRHHHHLQMNPKGGCGRKVSSLESLRQSSMRTTGGPL